MGKSVKLKREDCVKRYFTRRIKFPLKADFHNAINSIRENGVLNTAQIKAVQFEAVVIQEELAMPSKESYWSELWKTLRLNHLIASLGALDCT